LLSLLKVLNNNKSIFLCLIIGSLFTAHRYNIPWEWPLIDFFTSIERLIDKNYLENDFTTNTFNEYSARYFISYYYYYFSELLNIDYTVFIKWNNIFRIFLSIFISFFLFYGFFRNKYLALISFTLVSLSFFGSYSGFSKPIPITPGWSFISSLADAHGIAIFFFIISWAFLFNNKINFSILFLAPAMLVHPIVAINLLPINFIISIIFFKQKRISFNYISILFFILLLTCFLLNYIPYQRSIIGYENLSDNLFIKILAHFRHPWHYLPSKMSINEWIDFSFYLFFYIFLLIHFKDVKEKIIFHYFIYYFLFIIVIGYLFTEIYPIKFIISLSLYRSLIFFNILFIALYSHYTYINFVNKNYLIFFISLIPFTKVINIYIVEIFFSNSAVYNNYLSYLALVLLFIIKFINLKFYYFNNFASKIINFLKLENHLLIFFFLLYSLFFYKFSIEDNNYSFSLYEIPTINNQHYVYQWIANNTDVDDIIISERSIERGFNQKIRLISRRAIVVDFEFPFLEKYYLEWYNRFKDIYQEPMLADGNIDSLSNDEIYNLSKKYFAYKIIRSKPLNKEYRFKLIEILKYKPDLNIYLYSVEK
tara:strand:- start:377 stop:2158 length:1782 start_codon:yes stop_codon:yes gene_type:complete